MLATRISFRAQTTAEQALSDMRLLLMTIGADLIDSTSQQVLAVRGLVEVCALSLKTSEAVDLLAGEVKARQSALRAAPARADGNACHCPVKCDVCHCVERGAAGVDAGGLARTGNEQRVLPGIDQITS